MTNLKNIEQVVEQFHSDIEELNRELKRVASVKCRLKKQKFKPTYEEEMTKILGYEQVLKEAKNLLNPKEKFVTDYDSSDIELLDYDETIKAIKSIQSKKTNTRYLTPVEGDNDEFRNACRIEQMLLEHKNNIKPVEDTVIRKSDLQTIIDTIESNHELSQERILELLKGLM